MIFLSIFLLLFSTTIHSMQQCDACPADNELQHRVVHIPVSFPAYDSSLNSQPPQQPQGMGHTLKKYSRKCLKGCCDELCLCSCPRRFPFTFTLCSLGLVALLKVGIPPYRDSYPPFNPDEL